jgi:glycosyltransferase involved in cell wall biosynthesis
MLKKIAIIGTVGLPSNYGGFETLTEYLTKYLGDKFDFTVFCSSKSYNKKIKTYNNAKLKYLPLNANGIQSIFYDILSIFYALFFADVLLILGVSGCVFLPLVKLISSKKIIVNIDGLEWKRQKWNKVAKRFLKFSEVCAVKYANVIIADNKVIKDYVYSNYKKNAHLIAYGGDHCNLKKQSYELLKKFPFLEKKYAFKVCRIEPENNIEIILEAFAQADKIPLVLIGNWNNSTFGKQIKSKYQDFETIYLLDPIYDQDVLNGIRSNCEFYIHGHSAGGTNPSLVEAMSLGLPILCYDINYNDETTENSALYFKSSLDLINLIKSISQEEIKLIGNRMYDIARNKYKWSIISNQYMELFEKY